MLRSFSRGLLRTKTIDSVFAVFSRLTNERLKINVFFHVCPRFDIETCKKSECDSLQSPTSHGSLQFGGKDCGQWNASFLNYLFHVGTVKSAGQSSMYVRFVSDDTVHGKGFNLSYVTGSCDGTQAKWPWAGGGGGGRYSTKCNTGRLHPEVQSPTLLYPFGRKDTPFIYFLLKKGTPFTYLL